MTVTLVWGKDFEFENTVLSTGGVYEELFGVEGGSEGIAASSVREVMAVAAKYGVSVDLWPVYPDCQVDKNVPLSGVRLEFDKIPDDVVAQDYWLEIISRMLRNGNMFFIMGI